VSTIAPKKPPDFRSISIAAHGQDPDAVYQRWRLYTDTFTGINVRILYTINCFRINMISLIYDVTLPFSYIEIISLFESPFQINKQAV
jgi:hypothetical protein